MWPMCPVVLYCFSDRLSSILGEVKIHGPHGADGAAQKGSPECGSEVDPHAIPPQRGPPLDATQRPSRRSIRWICPELRRRM